MSQYRVSSDLGTGKTTQLLLVTDPWRDGFFACTHRWWRLGSSLGLGLGLRRLLLLLALRQ
eukprot:COSAG01_NODE_58513_length_305_cov_1.485437_1_plen_60_part_10